jgi:hypothetical protein
VGGDRMVNTGLITDKEMDEFLGLHDDKDFVWMGCDGGSSFSMSGPGSH